MRHAHLVLSGLVFLLGCGTGDPRLPQRMYDDAVKLSQQGRSMEARTLMAQVAERYPDTDAGRKAQKDLHLLEAFLRQDIQAGTRQVRAVMKSTSNALRRYLAKKGEYPQDLHALLPDYLDKLPETPWGHPLLYRPFVGTPVVEVKDRRGATLQKFNTKLDRFQLVCLGSDFAPKGKDLAADLVILDGEWVEDASLLPLPLPQPAR